MFVTYLLQFFEVYHGYFQLGVHDDVDAYLVVYSVTDSQSFAHACDLLNTLCETGNQHKAVILVANKCDIVRNRTVQENGKPKNILFCKYFFIYCHYYCYYYKKDHSLL